MRKNSLLHFLLNSMRKLCLSRLKRVTAEINSSPDLHQ